MPGGKFNNRKDVDGPAIDTRSTVIKILDNAKLHIFQKFEIDVTKYSSMSIT